jgi:hypothetical protein
MRIHQIALRPCTRWLQANALPCTQRGGSESPGGAPRRQGPASGAPGSPHWVAATRRQAARLASAPAVGPAHSSRKRLFTAPQRAAAPAAAGGACFAAGWFGQSTRALQPTAQQAGLATTEHASPLLRRNPCSTLIALHRPQLHRRRVGLPPAHGVASGAARPGPSPAAAASSGERGAGTNHHSNAPQRRQAPSGPAKRRMHPMPCSHTNTQQPLAPRQAMPTLAPHKPHAAGCAGATEGSDLQPRRRSTPPAWEPRKKAGGPLDANAHKAGKKDLALSVNPRHNQRGKRGSPKNSNCKEEMWGGPVSCPALMAPPGLAS